MKTFDSLYDEIISLPNLYRAYALAKEGKKDKTYIEFNKAMHENLWSLHEELRDRAYSPSPYTVFYVDDYKRRRIMAPHFRDHVVHHAIHNFVEQLYDACFIYDSFACRTGKGTHKAFSRLRKFMYKYSDNSYFMKCDISKYFYSIDHRKLISVIRKKIKDTRLLWLLSKVIGSHCEDKLPSHIDNIPFRVQKKGIPIGNLTSQLFANIYLNEMDYYIKHELKVKHYVRYVDDFVFFGGSKKELNGIFSKTQEFLEKELFLKLERRKVQLNKLSFGVDFLGFVAFNNYTRVRTRNYRRFKIRIKKKISSYYSGEIDFEKLSASFNSYQSHLAHTNSEKIKKDIDSIHDAAALKAEQSNGAVTGTMGQVQGCST